MRETVSKIRSRVTEEEPDFSACMCTCVHTHHTIKIPVTPFFKLFIFILGAMILSLHVCLHECAFHGVTDSCELSYWCWDMNLSPLGEHSVLSNAEPPL